MQSSLSAGVQRCGGICGSSAGSLGCKVWGEVVSRWFEIYPMVRSVVVKMGAWVGGQGVLPVGCLGGN